MIPCSIVRLCSGVLLLSKQHSHVSYAFSYSPVYAGVIGVSVSVVIIALVILGGGGGTAVVVVKTRRDKKKKKEVGGSGLNHALQCLCMYTCTHMHARTHTRTHAGTLCIHIHTYIIVYIIILIYLFTSPYACMDVFCAYSSVKVLMYQC